MNNPRTHSQGLTLEEITARRQALKAAIAEQRKNVDEAYRQAIAPFTEARSVTKYIGSNLLSGVTLLESAIWGFRLMSRIFRMFKRFR
ncbi:hypothetical protein [Barnesiella sp. An55]|uniref:hypothetical protein n=1 Tax=Barnesiella sp. An55 TaxID=1965646 RepID=UPI000B3782C1|nr:hypothetical protein [Barnesiella sp. An55]OUN74652.1 hypothetical protein B5G10_00020 [Barnesiella sp. An55]HIZ27039.1 hypothetical protein [Candidatus Barnesiella merdipullorum]